MKHFWVILTLAPLLNAQHPAVGNPNAEGDSLYRSNCAFCHGVTGKGGRGPDLTGRRSHGDTLDDVKRVIQQGIPGTTMPAFGNFLPDELDRLAEYTQAFANAGATSTMKITGNAEAGKAVYAKSGCKSCHAIDGEGSIYGPDLSRIGAARSTEYIRESIVKPSADVPLEWEGVIVTTKDGKRLQALKVNEDTFTIQLRDPAGRFRMFDKIADLKSVEPVKHSIMPSYEKLPPKDLDDLLAYLDTLRANVKATGPAKRMKGIH
jgi:cytochrome c oxidase cbb3-type subunit 3